MKTERRNTKMKNRYFIGLFALSIVALLGVGMVAANPFGYNMGLGQDLSDEDHEMMMEEQATLMESIQNGDYESWSSLMNQQISRMQEQITEENFNTLVEQHAQMEEFRNAMQEARESGDFSKVQELKEQYGLEDFGRGQGHMHEMGGEGCPFAEAE